jgi:hypothetical protein
MRLVSPVKVGISGSVITLIACGYWFITTDQATIISQRAWHAQEEYVASERAVDRGGSVANMKRMVYAACTPKDLTPGARPEPPVSTEECANNYIYGDGLIHGSAYFFIWQWTQSLLQIVAYVAVAGIAIGATVKFVPLGLKAW